MLGQSDAAPPAWRRAFEAYRGRLDTDCRCQQRSATGVGLLLIRAVFRDRHPVERPCRQCSMAMSGPPVKRLDGVRIAMSVPIMSG